MIKKNDESKKIVNMDTYIQNYIDQNIKLKDELSQLNKDYNDIISRYRDKLQVQGSELKETKTKLKYHMELNKNLSNTINILNDKLHSLNKCI